MPLQTFIVDSFTNTPFKGNPAGVCIADNSLSETTMQQIAFELGLSETAFITKSAESDVYNIRYFSPQKEIALCGHATLAAAKVLNGKTGSGDISFITGGGISLQTTVESNEITMQFPVYELRPATAPVTMLTALGITETVAVFRSIQNKILMLEIESAAELANLQPDFAALKASQDDINGVLVTAVSGNDTYDYEYRYFWPWAGTNEDPVTGGVQTFLARYWAVKLQKNKMTAFQSSQRTGFMTVELKDEKVFITGQAVIILEGNLIHF